MLAVDFDPARAAMGDHALQGTAFFAKFSVGEIRMVRTRQPAGRKPAGKGHFQRIAVVIGGRRRLSVDRGIERFSIDPGDGGDVFRRLQASFDLE